MYNNFDHCSLAVYHLSTVINIQNKNNLLDSGAYAHYMYTSCCKIFDIRYVVDVIKMVD